jgi:hypothetical protein
MAEEVVGPREKRAANSMEYHLEMALKYEFMANYQDMEYHFFEALYWEQDMLWHREANQ